MANLPSNTFLFNYNAKEYNPTTKTLPKTSGQLFDEDIVFSGTPYAYDGECIDFSGNGTSYTAWYGHDYFLIGADSNPFNRSSADTTFTAIYKTADFISGSENLIANRGGGNYNYMIRGNMFHTQDSGYLGFTPSGNPQYIIIRVNSDGSAERKEVDSNGNTIQSVSASTIEWGGKSYSIGFFSGYGNQVEELFTAKFYWVYCSNEALSDSEILQVIKYNEGIADNLSISKEEMSFSYSGGTDSLVVTSLENTWSASTNDNWISISPTTGTTGETTVTISVNLCLDSRTGTVTFTDGTDSVSLSISQSSNNSIKIDNLYYNGSKVKQLILNNVIVHRNLEDISQ